MQKKRVGRPKKQNAVKSGQLKKGECRFTFITTEDVVNKIRDESKKRNIKIKEYIKSVFDHYWKSKINYTQNEELIKRYIKKVNLD